MRKPSLSLLFFLALAVASCRNESNSGTTIVASSLGDEGEGTNNVPAALTVDDSGPGVETLLAPNAADKANEASAALGGTTTSTNVPLADDVAGRIEATPVDSAVQTGGEEREDVSSIPEVETGDPFSEATQALASPEVACPICEFDAESYDGPLAPAEVAGLLLALNDEYHAYAVYGQVISDFGQVRPFVNIQRSEAKHISSLASRFEAYGVPLPVNGNPWLVQVEAFPSVTAACVTGVEAEILNRDLYARLFASTDRADILAMYEALQRASDENHLPAFSRCSGG